MPTTTSILNDENGSLRASVRIDESDCPVDADGRPDHGNATWPTDAEVSAEVSAILGRPVVMRFRDAGDDLLEGIFGEASSLELELESGVAP